MEARFGDRETWDVGVHSEDSPLLLLIVGVVGGDDIQLFQVGAAEGQARNHFGWHFDALAERAIRLEAHHFTRFRNRDHYSALCVDRQAVRDPLR